MCPAEGTVGGTVLRRGDLVGRQQDPADTIAGDHPLRTREIVGHPAGARRRRSGPASRMRVTAFVVDDHAVVRAGIRRLLEEQDDFVVIGEAGDATRAVEAICRARPDIALIDMRLPGGDGVEIIRELRARECPTRCLVLTTFPDEAAFFQAVVAGACGYLLKEAPAEELLEACRGAADGASLFDPGTLEDLRARIRQVPTDDDLLVQLTPQERRILGYVAEGMTNREIAGKLDLAEKTVRNYVSNVLIKMDMKNRTMAAAYMAQYAARTAARRATSAVKAAQ